MNTESQSFILYATIYGGKLKIENIEKEQEKNAEMKMHSLGSRIMKRSNIPFKRSDKRRLPYCVISIRCCQHAHSTMIKNKLCSRIINKHGGVKTKLPL